MSQSVKRTKKEKLGSESDSDEGMIFYISNSILLAECLFFS